MGIQTWFPTSIYSERLTEKRSLEKFNRELAQECYSLMEFDEEGRAWSKTRYVGGYTSFGSLSELHRMSSTFLELEQKISRHVSRFVEHLEMDLGEGALEMTDFWVNVMPSQTSHSMHIHPLSVISGTYYVQTPRNAAEIKFEDPRLDKFMAAPPKRPGASRRNRQIAKMKPKAGHLVLFESWLRHEVPASLTKEDRISVSFNYNWV
jgi:uncharacterized protein (TIGR02466 family)